MAINHVSGQKKGNVMLYALSTCGWCKKTRELLEDLGVEYDFTYVDLLRGEEQKSTLREIEKVNPDGNFPTIIIDGKKCIVGYKESEIREALK
jgi:glutaredoxin-like protein NrdH